MEMKNLTTSAKFYLTISLVFTTFLVISPGKLTSFTRLFLAGGTERLDPPFISTMRKDRNTQYNTINYVAIEMIRMHIIVW